MGIRVWDRRARQTRRHRSLVTRNNLDNPCSVNSPDVPLLSGPFNNNTEFSPRREALMDKQGLGTEEMNVVETAQGLVSQNLDTV